MRATRQRIRAVFYAVLARDSGGTVTVSAGVEFVAEIVVFRCGKMKTDFQHFYPHGSKEKISGSDFEIRATNFKKQATNF